MKRIIGMVYVLEEYRMSYCILGKVVMVIDVSI